MTSSQPVWIQKETMSLTIMIMLGVLLTNVCGAKLSDSIDNRVEKLEVLLQNMSEQLNNEHQARIEMEKQLNNEHLARIDMEKQLNNEHLARIEMEKQLNNENQARVEMKKQLNNEHQARVEMEKQLNNEHLARMELEKKLATTERRISSRQLAHDPEIAFLAYRSTDVYSSFIGQVIVFDKVITNIDSTNSLGGYKQGLFTAPVDGIYVFSTTLMAHEGSSSSYAIYHDIRPVVRLDLISVNLWWYSASANVVLSLSKGEQVSVRDDVNGDHYLEGAVDSTGQTMFSGFLLKSHNAVAPIIG
ncbi:uncharacterized protein LOC127835500 [Dreissena polymorpha]|uniref:uncharacterized protein LOC127835500 n=1 Tax=Dreissena polymorpha TaxID=45954 RepID=UPI00226563C8|nr:uncharacterized protein LOC127835500 [Dreissena polymorpha]